MNRKRILIVEDEAIVARHIQRTLESLGYFVVGTVTSGREALDSVVPQPPDLVLMDIQLRGGMDGIEAAEHLRDRFHLPVVFLTAFVDDATIERAKLTEPFGYVIKPFEDRELHTAIQMALYRHKAERRLEENEAWLATILTSIADAVIATDAKDHITFMNSEAERLTGWGRSDALKAEIKEVFVRCEPPTDGLPAIEEPLRDMPGGERIENWLLARDGKSRPIEGLSSPIIDPSGRSWGTVLAFRDIAQRKLAQSRLEEREEQLRQAQKLEAVGRLAGGVAFEFTNLLTVMKGCADLLLEDLPQDSPLRALAAKIDQSSQRASLLVRQLQTISHRDLVEPRQLDLGATVQDLRPMVRSILGTNVALDIVTASDVHAVLADRNQIEQMITNMAFNARDAMPTGGQFTIAVANVDLLASQALELPGLHPGPHVLLTLTDTGSGMDEETRAHLFEPFFTTKGRGLGTGLGLATVYGIIQQWGGHLAVASHPGRGTEFKVYLPASSEKAEPTVPEAFAVAEGGTETILVVEDDEDVRDLIAQVLRHYGYRVLEAADGPSAIRKLSEHSDSIDLLVADVMLPQMIGTDLAAKLQQMRPHLKVIYVSGYAESARVRETVDRVGVHFLAKPFRATALALKIREVLDRKAAGPPGE